MNQVLGLNTRERSSILVLVSCLVNLEDRELREQYFDELEKLKGESNSVAELTWLEQRFLDEAINKVRDKVRNEVRNEVRSEVRDEVRSEVRDEVRKEVRDEVRSEVRDEVRSEVRDEVRSEVRDEVRKEVHNEAVSEGITIGEARGKEQGRSEILNAAIDFMRSNGMTNEQIDSFRNSFLK